MMFEEILPLLRAGKTARRTGNRPYKWVRVADPKIEKDLDGPEYEWVIHLNGRMCSHFSVFETEEEATAALSLASEDMFKEWETFQNLRREFEAKVEEGDHSAVSPTAPKNRISYYADAKVIQRAAARLRRLSVPIFLCLRKDGVVAPWYPNAEDILATDWKA